MGVDEGMNRIHVVAMHFAIKLVVHVVVFGIALTFATRKVKGVSVQPRSMLPLVALMFAGLNQLLYWALTLSVKLVTLWTLAFLAPLVANAVLLLLTDRLMKPFKIEGFKALAYTSVIMTVAHLALRLAHAAIPQF